MGRGIYIFKIYISPPTETLRWSIPHRGKGETMTKQDALEELNSAIYRCSEAGIKIMVGTMFGSSIDWAIGVQDNEVDYGPYGFYVKLEAQQTGD